MAHRDDATKPTSTSGEESNVSPEWKKPRTVDGAEADEEPITAALTAVHARHASDVIPMMSSPRGLIPPLFAGGSTLASIPGTSLTPASDNLSEVVPAEVALPASSDEGGGGSLWKRSRPFPHLGRASAFVPGASAGSPSGVPGPDP